MQITNGTVSRTVKPADYEGRSVTLSFTVDPGDDIEPILARLLSLAERYVRAGYSANEPEGIHDRSTGEVRPAPATLAEPPKTRTSRKPPVVVSTATVEPEAQAAEAEVIPPANSATNAASGGDTPDTTEAAQASSTDGAGRTVTNAASPSEPAPKEITNADLNAAIASTHQRLGKEYPELSGDEPEKVKVRGDLVRVWRDQITGQVGMSVGQMDQGQREKFLAGLPSLAPAV